MEGPLMRRPMVAILAVRFQSYCLVVYRDEGLDFEHDGDKWTREIWRSRLTWSGFLSTTFCASRSPQAIKVADVSALETRGLVSNAFR
jgi:hypothetical protein